MTQFIKTSTGLQPVDDSKIKVYDSIDAAQAALENGDLAENEIIATKFNDADDDIALEINTISDDVSTIKSYIPSGTDATTNTLVNQDMLSTATGGTTSVYCGNTCVCGIDPTHALCLNAAAFDGVDLTDITTDITNLQSCPGLNCTGTVVASDLTNFINATCAGTIAVSCIALHSGVDCTGTVVDSDLTSFIDATCAGNIAASCIASHPGVDCTGTVVASDLTSFIDASCACTVADAQIATHDGVDCVGTVTSVNNCAPDANGNVTVEGGYDIAVYCGTTCKCSVTKNAATLCLGNGAFATITMSGNDMTITF